MFYISKVSPFLFLFALFNLLLSLFLKSFGFDREIFFLVLVFGFVGNTLLGAMYQIVPNSQNRKLSNSWLSYVVVLGVLVSFALIYSGILGLGTSLLALSYLIFSLHIALNVKNWMPVTVKFLGVSALYIALSSVFLFFHYNFSLVSLQLAIHTLTVGAMLNAVYGVEVAWIPMLLMETLNIKKAKKLFYGKQVSTLALLLCFWLMEYRLLAVASLLEIGVALYYLYVIYELIKHRKMPSPVPYVVRLFILALAFLPLGMIVGSTIASRPEVLLSIYDLHIDLLIYGFTAFTIFGGIAHLFPRIMWNWKFSSGGAQAPSISELVDEGSFPRFMELSFVFFVLFLAVDMLFSPLNKLSAVLFFVILSFFFKLTFLHFIKKLKEVKDVGGQSS